MADLCGGGDDASGEIRRQEEERQARIKEGTNRINQIFGGDISTDVVTQVPHHYENGPGHFTNEGRTLMPGGPVTTYSPLTIQKKSHVPGQYTDDFYHGLEQNYSDYYRPQLQRQERDADRGLKIDLARSGNLNGSVGATKIGRLAEDKSIQERALVDNALKYSNDARTKNEQTRANLVGQLENGAGIENVANQAAAAVDASTAPPAFSPLGDLFKNYSSAVANASIAAGNPGAFPGADNYRKSLLFNNGGSSSATTVN